MLIQYTIHDYEGKTTNQVTKLLKIRLHWFVYWKQIYTEHKVGVPILSRWKARTLKIAQWYEWSLRVVIAILLSLQFTALRNLHSLRRNIVAQKIRSKGKYTAFGKHTAQRLESLGDKMTKFCKKIIRDTIFEMQMGTLNRTSPICTEISQKSWPYPQTSTPHTVAGQGRQCFRILILPPMLQQDNISGIPHYDIQEQ
jgi:hypothetical protein